MLCCPCLPFGKRNKVRQGLEAASLPPKRSRPVLNRLRRLFRQKQEVVPEKVPPPSEEVKQDGTLTLNPDLSTEVKSEGLPDEEKDELVEPGPLESTSRASSHSSLDRVVAQVEEQEVPTGEQTLHSLILALQQMTQLRCRGLPNEDRNICYMNATLQCLFHLQPFCTQLLAQEEMWRLEPKALVLRTFIGLFQQRSSGDFDMKEAILCQLKDLLALHNREFEGNSQNDAHEFLCECLLRLQDAGRTLGMVHTAYRCPVDTLLSFQLCYRRSCQRYVLQMNCGVERTREELNIMLSLDLVMQGTVQHSLQQYFAETQVEFKCQYCEGQGSTMRLSFSTLPQVLILHIKRICPLTLTKKHQALTLDPSLELSTHVERPEEQEVNTAVPSEGQRGPENLATNTYKLVNVLSHIGLDATNGHYIADCNEGKQWITCNDAAVSRTSEEAVLRDRERTAYILFYLRQ